MFRILGKDHPRFGISISEDIIAKMSIAKGEGTIYDT